MTLKEIICRHPTWAGARYYLLGSYPETRDDVDKYGSVFEALVYMVPRPSTVHIFVDSVLVPGGGAAPSVRVFGRDGRMMKDMPDFDRFGRSRESPLADTLVSFALQFVPWEDWLGMEIDPRTLETVEETAIIAHCLKNMTFAGFDQEKIRRRWNELKAEVGKGAFRPWRPTGKVA
ncbi:MAG: hypothetical protein FJY95_15485 [Candidatus Handelsmanbacteria bacterium]|nr:hypothetical protein [Candidatus Handelsmanbacteria bacterium]